MYSTWTKQQVMAFVGAYGKDIVEAITDTGLYFPAFVAQNYIESRSSSGDGLSKLATSYNNFGGIKTKNDGSLPPFANGTVDSLTGEGSRDTGTYHKEQATFVTYPTPKDSFLSHVAILKQDIYVQAGVFSANSPEDQIIKIAQAGYTTATPQEYLRLIQGSLDACRDIYKLGLINSNAPAGIGNNGAQGQWPSAANGWDFLSFIKQTTQEKIANTGNIFGIKN
jgi:hypothetical protein